MLSLWADDLLANFKRLVYFGFQQLILLYFKVAIFS